MSMILLFVSLLLSHGVIELHASHHVYNHLQNAVTFSNSLPSDDQPYRTAYHFQSLKNWINVWAPPIWAHSTSTDLVNWTPQPIAIQAQIEANINGSWSGSTTILPGNKPAMLFTRLNPKYEQVQVLAFPKDLSDPYLKEWAFVAQNPIMYPTPENNINASSFRDPTTAWMLPDGKWRVLVGSKTGTTGTSLLFRSKDFVNWIQAKHTLYSYNDSGMWECPDFLPVDANGKAIGVETSAIGPKLDDTKHDIYTIGSYDVKKDAYMPDVGFMNDSSLRYDYGKYYASKMFFDDVTKRRILLGWANESSSVEDDSKKDGLLIQWPVCEIKALREKPVKISTKVIRGGSLVEIPGITATQVDVEMSFAIHHLRNIEKFEASWTDPQLFCSQKGTSVKGGLDPFGLLTLASKNLEEYTAVFFRVFKANHNKFFVLMCNPTPDKTTYGTFVDVNPIHEGLPLRVLIDHSVVESFGGKGKNVNTSRVYPTLAKYDNAHLFAFNYGMSSIKTLP
ncbi:Fructan 6-exohydrolase [Bienertia sinuspersici]